MQPQQQLLYAAMLTTGAGAGAGTSGAGGDCDGECEDDAENSERESCARAAVDDVDGDEGSASLHDAAASWLSRRTIARPGACSQG